MNRSILACPILAVIIFLNSGCSSIICRAATDDDSNGEYLYQGAAMDCIVFWEALPVTENNLGVGAIGYAGLIDLPFSVCLDTLLLPKDLYLISKWKEKGHPLRLTRTAFEAD